MTEIRAAAPSGALQRLFEQQAARNQQLLKQTPTLGGEIRSEVLPFAVDLKAPALPDDAERALAALEKTAATDRDRVADLAREGQRHRSSRRRPRADRPAADDARRGRLPRHAVLDRARPHQHRLLLGALGARLPAARARHRTVPPQPRHRRPRALGARRHADRLGPPRHHRAGHARAGRSGSAPAMATMRSSSATAATPAGFPARR